MARKSAFGHGLDSTVYMDREKAVDPTSSGASYRRDVFEKAGFFDENFNAADDVELNCRAGRTGFKSFSSPKLAVCCYPRNSIGSLFKQMKRYGIGRFRFLRKHRHGISSGALLPALFYVGLILLVFLSILSNRLLPIAGILLALYLAANLISSLAVAPRRDSKGNGSSAKKSWVRGLPRTGAGAAKTLSENSLSRDIPRKSRICDLRRNSFTINRTIEGYENRDQSRLVRNWTRTLLTVRRDITI
jgi:GT2 family glycosyltransferase